MRLTSLKTPTLFALALGVGVLASRLVRSWEIASSPTPHKLPVFQTRPRPNPMVMRPPKPVTDEQLRTDDWVRLFDVRSPQLSFQRMLMRLKTMSGPARWQLAEQFNQMQESGRIFTSWAIADPGAAFVWLHEHLQAGNPPPPGLPLPLLTHLAPREAMPLLNDFPDGKLLRELEVTGSGVPLSAICVSLANSRQGFAWALNENGGPESRHSSEVIASKIPPSRTKESGIPAEGMPL